MNAVTPIEERIEAKLDHATAAGIVVSDKIGGIQFNTMVEIMEFAKLMALSNRAVRKHLRGNPGACLAVCVQASEWRMSPFAVANKSYEVNDQIAYEAQLIHAVIEARAPLKQRLRYRFEGEGPTRKCKVIGHFKGEVDPVELETPMFKDIKVKNSPLWTSDPDQQFCYYGARAFARRYCPDVILGIYAADELEGVGADRAVDVTPAATGLAARLPGKGATGFNQESVEAAIGGKAKEPEKAQQQQPEAKTETAPAAEKPADETPAVAQADADGQTAMDLSVGVEQEIEAKKRALTEAESEDDVKALVETTTAYLKKAERTDLLADFLSAAKAKEKALKKAAKTKSEF